MGDYKRRQYLINKGFQFRYMMVIILAMMCVSIVVGWTVYSTVWGKLSDPRFVELSQLYIYFEQANITLLYRVIALIIFIAIASIFVSHKIAGPVYRFTQVAKSIADGDLSLKVKLRKGDELKELEESFNFMTESLKNLIEEDHQIAKEINSIIVEIEEKLEDGSVDKATLGDIKEKLRNISGKLKQIGSNFKLDDNREKSEENDSEGTE